MLLSRLVPEDLMAELDWAAQDVCWWQVDWPDGRRTSFRSQDDALQLAREIGAALPRREATL